jgi:hydrogenase maturation protein HypF
MDAVADHRARVRCAVRLRGTVQGVGLRPAICRIAVDLALGGFVRNDEQGVLIEVEGGPDAVGRFERALPAAAPAIAEIRALEITPLAPVGESTFRIAPSATAGGAAHASIPVDLAPCADCLRELFDPRDRRHRYPFINCTACGPRFTIVWAIPYDRPLTTMAPFTMCAACRAEYEDPRDRRFHAEPNACPACGPTLTFEEPGAPDRHGEEALAAAVERLARGAIVAVKGAGGFLLAVDACDAAAVARLRQLKQRPHKPLAVMADALADLEEVAVLDDAARRALLAPSRPIVLAPARAGSPLAAEVAPGLREVGVFLPATPLQQLLFEGGVRWLVMTSGNRSDEPIARDDDEARRNLAGVADAFLLHDRAVHARADDSVARVIAGAPALLRRARGFVPAAIPLPFEGPPILAVGATLKTAICLSRGGEALLSQHLGDLSDADVFAFFEETVAKLQALAGTRPRAVAHDLHPDYRSTRWAQAWAQANGLRCEPVQHHHAHVASCLAEHGRIGPVLGVVFDGTGLGPDGTLWGGELLAAHLSGFRRLGHLRPLRLLGGEAAIRQPWRLAAAALLDAGEELDLLAGGAGRAAAARLLWERPALAPLATGAGRWFDAVAALCGLGSEVSYDGQPAIELEAAASDGEHAPYDFQIDAAPAEPFAGDQRPAVRAIAGELRAGAAPGHVAARFHETLAAVIATACLRARDGGAPSSVALTGGCFQNRRLTERAAALLERAGFEVLLQRRVPSNDGGLALGQAAVAAYRARPPAIGAQEAATCV